LELPRRLPPRRPAKNSRSGSSGSKRRGVPHLGAPDGGSGTALVVGLGNPGRKYRNTRHNLGRMAAEAVADRSEVLSQGRWPQGRLALVSAGGRRFLILAPETFMNVSGCAVAPVVERRTGPRTARRHRPASGRRESKERRGHRGPPWARFTGAGAGRIGLLPRQDRGRQAARRCRRSGLRIESASGR
jgi:hypothetical protein